MKVRFLNRKKTITANNSEDIVNWMRTNDLERYRDNLEFMKSYAERKRLFENIHIPSEDADSFVKGLENHKIIEIVKNRLFVSFKRQR